MDNIHVEFLHYQVEFDNDVMRRLSSRYYSKKEAGQKLRHWLLKNPMKQLKPINKFSQDFESGQLIGANEVFPEAALADPVADLKIWDQWRTGLRRFPYPGVYTRLGILTQDSKTSATSSVGALGEIFTGLFAQSFISPLVTVRPIRRWPDFIFLGNDGRFSFVESKASASINESKTFDIKSVNPSLLSEALADALQELNSDPSLGVWFVFTDIMSIQPLVAHICALEVNAPDSRQAESPSAPDAVVDGWAQRIMKQSSAKLEDEFSDLLDFDASEISAKDVSKKAKKSGKKKREEEFWKKLKETASNSVEAFIPDVLPRDQSSEIKSKIIKRISSQRSHKIMMQNYKVEGHHLVEAKREASKGRLAPLRDVSKNEQLMLADLDSEELAAFRAQWQPDWERANQPWGELDGLKLWRYSGAILGLMPPEHQGRRIKEARRTVDG